MLNNDKYLSLFWYRWTGQLGQAKLRSITYESGKSTTHHIVFDPAFPETPALVYGLSHLDSIECENMRFTTAINYLSNTGFNLTTESWKPTLTCDAWVQWMACPKLFWPVMHSWCRRTQLYLIIYKVFLLLKMFPLIQRSQSRNAWRNQRCYKTP